MPTPADPAPPRRQRVAAYALVTRDDGALLMARIAQHVVAEGRWTLPGGGVDHGEDLRAAAVREVYEETGLHVRVGRVLDVRSAHWVGPRPDGVVEDFHAVQVVYAGELLPQSFGVEPHVTEVDGSTDTSAWVPRAEVTQLALVPLAVHALGLLDP